MTTKRATTRARNRSLLSQQEGPEGEGDGEPDGREGAGGDEGAGAVTHEDEADGAGVDEEGEGSGDHGAGFERDVGGAVAIHGERDGSEGDGGSGGEDAAQALGLEDVTEDGEDDDDEAADEETGEEVRHRAVHGRAFFPAFAMRSRMPFGEGRTYSSCSWCSCVNRV